MIQYTEEIIVPYVNAVRDLLNDNKAAVVIIIMENFKVRLPTVFYPSWKPMIFMYAYYLPIQLTDYNQ